ncbi:MAG: carboxypeptidase-like regulatory domain-containing protein [Verrucomicrobiaceae bacterium]|nr:carboxypeptidase-like regulatory domain-containing protein [Verrucomicrobiaceae bacterium]
MTRSKKRFRLLALFLILGLGCGVLFTGREGHQQSKNEKPRAGGDGAQTSQPLPTAESLAHLPERDRTALNVLKSIYSASIDVFCKVVDEEGKPVPGANVEYSLNDKYFKSGTKGQTVSAPDGTFRVQGNGASVWLRVQHPDYFWIRGKSEGAIPANKVTSASAPAVFVLKTMGPKAPLTHNRLTTKRVAHDGTPVGLDLKTPQPVAADGAPIQVRVWVIDAKPQQWSGYRWKAEIRVPGGGFRVREDELDFEAPEDGYTEVLEFSMHPTDPSESWASRIPSNDYFIKLGDGTYARGVLNLSTLPDRAMVSLESWWNETGGRNLQAGKHWFGRAQ